MIGRGALSSKLLPESLPFMAGADIQSRVWDSLCDTVKKKGNRCYLVNFVVRSGAATLTMAPAT